MNRDKAAWSRVVVCVSKSTITVLGQDASGTNGSTLLINRVHISDIVEVPTAAITEASYKSVMTGHALVGFWNSETPRISASSVRPPLRVISGTTR